MLVCYVCERVGEIPLFHFDRVLFDRRNSVRTVDTVQELVAPTVAELGYELVEVEFVKEAAGWVLTLYIDSPDGITLDDCEKVSRAVDPILDEADPIEQAYYLSVSSLGIDCPLKKDRDFERSLDTLVTVKLYAAINKKKEFTGTLVSYDQESFVIRLQKTDEELTIRRKDAAMVKPYIEF